MSQIKLYSWRRRAGYVVVVIGGLLTWIGMPEFNKWQADRVVDDLCTKDGGDRVYEVIKLPAGKFDSNWLVNLGGIESARTGAEYYVASSIIDIQGDHNGADVGQLVIWKTDTKIVRAADRKVMAELVSYVRRGGDPIGPWHPSHYQCPKGGFVHEVFIKE